jgi:AAA domain
VFLVVVILVRTNWPILTNAVREWKLKRQQFLHYLPSVQVSSKIPTQEVIMPDTPPEIVQPEMRKRYRKNELNRILASLRAAASILVVGETGSGKSLLFNDTIAQLEGEGFQVIAISTNTHKELLLDIAAQLGIEKVDINNKKLSIYQLQAAITVYLQNNTAFLLVDDAHKCDVKFRSWLKDISRKTPMLLLATNPPKTDVFINLARLELRPLPEYAIREIMESAAIFRQSNLSVNDLARLQERVGGNPMLALRAVDEEFIGVDTEAGDHKQYFDMTPVILLFGVGFTIVRFIALGSSNPALYMLAGSSGALFMGASYAMRSLPKESRRF